jgi:4-deoxy-L-threo-5-hexosulose-uronate ketol-isomerase
MKQMQERYGNHPDEVQKMVTEELRKAFLIPALFVGEDFNFTYTHYDRMIIGGVSPKGKTNILETYDQLKADFFLQRREMGIINIGGRGTISADGETFDLETLDCLYLGKGVKEVRFESGDVNQPAKFYILSAPAHQTYPNTLMKRSAATPAQMGATATSNERIIYKYIHEAGIKSCQLVMGLTILKEGNVWNTMPPHTHNRRMEAYLYFDVKEEGVVFHFMGTANQTRHLVVMGEDAIISPPWSIHAGCGTASYSFIWGMAGENQSFADMDGIEIKSLQ